MNQGVASPNRRGGALVIRREAKTETQVTFKLWDGPDLGASQCGPDHVIAMEDLLVFKAKTERFDGQKPRKFSQVRVTLGSDASPLELCVGSETWVVVAVGTTTLTCDFSSKPPLPRRRLQSVAFARQGPADISARVFNSTELTIPSGVSTVLTFDGELFDDGNFHDASEPECLRPPVSGKYLINFYVQWQSNASGFRAVKIRDADNGISLAEVSQQAATGPGVEDQQVLTTHAQLDAGVCVHVQALQDSGTSLNLRVGGQGVGSGNSSLVFGMVRVP